MNKLSLIAIPALAGSLALNAWQYFRPSDSNQVAVTLSDSRSMVVGQDQVRKSSLEDVRAGGIEAFRYSFNSKTSHEDLAGIMTIRDPLERMQVLIEYIKNLPVEQIADRLADLRKGDVRDPSMKFLFHLLLTRWGQEDPEAAFANLGKVSARRGGDDANAILAGLAATDPERAVAWLTDPDNARQHQPWLEQMLARTLTTEWVRQDPDAVFVWAASLEPGDHKTGAYSEIIGSILETDPAGAASVVMELDPGERPELLEQIAASWARQSPEAAIEWVNTLEGDDRALAMVEAVVGWAQTAPQDAAAYVDRLPEEERASHVGGIARNWARLAPAEAVQWLGAQAESENKADAMGYAMWSWTNENPEAASTWLGDQPRGDSFDHGVTGLAKAATHAFDDPESGVVWSSTIQNEELRTSMTRHTLGRWMQQDPAAARAWADENGINVPSGVSGK